MKKWESFFLSVWFKIILLIVVFLPSYSQVPYDSANTPTVISAVLTNPLVVSIRVLLPIAKLLLLLATVLTFTCHPYSSKSFMGYCSFILFVVGVFQNMAYTQDYGFVWLIGNSLVMLFLAGLCLYDAVKHKTVFHKEHLERKRLWVFVPMLFAFFMPYAINAQGIIAPATDLSMLMNEAGVTYCMITPIILGIMILFSKDVYKPTLSMISFVGWTASKKREWVC